MSSRNTEIVRRWLAPELSRNVDALQAAIEEFCEPDVDHYPVRKFPEARPSHGREELRQFLTEFRQPWSHFEWVINDLIDVGEERVLACLSLRAEGRESAMNLEGDVYQCYWFRHGRFFRLEDHLTLSGALRALGLEGETLEAAGLRAPMSLDLVRSIYAAWGRGDFSSTDWAHPEIDFVYADGPTPGSWKGIAAMAEGWRDFVRTWDEFRIEVDEYVELDDDRVLVLSCPVGRGKASGLEVGPLRAAGAQVVQVRKGKVTRFVHYYDREQAVRDVELSREQSREK